MSQRTRRLIPGVFLMPGRFAIIHLTSQWGVGPTLCGRSMNRVQCAVAVYVSTRLAASASWRRCPTCVLASEGK